MKKLLLIVVMQGSALIGKCTCHKNSIPVYVTHDVNQAELSEQRIAVVPSAYQTDMALPTHVVTGGTELEHTAVLEPVAPPPGTVPEVVVSDTSISDTCILEQQPPVPLEPTGLDKPSIESPKLQGIVPKLPQPPLMQPEKPKLLHRLTLVVAGLATVVAVVAFPYIKINAVTHNLESFKQTILNLLTQQNEAMRRTLAEDQSPGEEPGRADESDGSEVVGSEDEEPAS